MFKKFICLYSKYIKHLLALLLALNLFELARDWSELSRNGKLADVFWIIVLLVLLALELNKPKLDTWGKRVQKEAATKRKIVKNKSKN